MSGEHFPGTDAVFVDELGIKTWHEGFTRQRLDEWVLGS